MAFAGTGWLKNLETDVLETLDEPSLESKYTSASLLRLIKKCWSRLWIDLQILDERLIVARYDITLVDNQLEYFLPPNVGIILSFAKIDTDTGRVVAEVLPTNHWDPGLLGFTLEGNVLRLTEKVTWPTSTSYRVLYVPNADFEPHEATIANAAVSVGSDGLTVTLPSSATDGSIDKRENGCAGQVFRILTASVGSFAYVQERVITAYNPVTRVCTFTVALSPIPTSGTVTYEIVPMVGNRNQLDDVLSLMVTREIAAREGRDKQFRNLTQLLIEAKRSLRLTLAKAQERLGARFDGRTRDNPDYYDTWGLAVLV